MSTKVLIIFTGSINDLIVHVQAYNHFSVYQVTTDNST